MNKELANKLDLYTEVIRDTMNDVITEIQGDYTGWCELGTMLMFRLIQDNIPNAINKVHRGYFKEDGHFWNEVDGCIIDTTVDQFGQIKVGVIESHYYKYYNKSSEITFCRSDLIDMTDSDGIYNFINYSVQTFKEV